MALQDLNEGLYRREGAARNDLHPKTFDPHFTHPQKQDEIIVNESRSWSERASGIFSENHRKAWKIGGIAVAIITTIALAGLAYVKMQQWAFSNEKVMLRIDGPREVGGSESARFTVNYANTNQAALENTELTISYPENFRPDNIDTNMLISGSSARIHIGDIAGHSQGKIEIKGTFYGSKGTLAYLKASMRYKPSNIGSEFQSEAQWGITVQSSSLRLEVGFPLQVASGDTAEYRVEYANTSDMTLSNLRLKVEYPEGFHFQTSTPKASEGETVWYLGNLDPGQKGVISLSGTLDGSKDEAKITRFHVGTLQGDGSFLSYSDTERLTKIVTSPLVIQQDVNGLSQLNVHPKDTLQYHIKYRNSGTIGLRNTIITLNIQSAALDFSRLILPHGGYDSTSKTITWKASDIPDLANLAPGKEGEIRFSVPVLENIPMASDTEKNFTIISTAKIDSPDVPAVTGVNKIISSNTLNIKVNSHPSLQAQIFYQDSKFPNAGPIPPQVGKETSYTVHWKFFNTTNDLDRVIASANLPTGVKWLGKTDPVSENITFNERTNQITWNLGSVASGTGGLKPVREVIFQISVVPQSNQVGLDIPLLNDPLLSAHDVFTDENLRASGNAKTTAIPEDHNIPGGSYQVVN